MIVGRARQSGALMRSKPRRNAMTSPSRKPPPRTMTEARAAPSTPSRGNGPRPMISRGSSRIDTPTEPASIRKGVRVSPAARNVASIAKNPNTSGAPGSQGGRPDEAAHPDAVDQIEGEVARHHRDGGRREPQDDRPQRAGRQRAGDLLSGRSVLPARARHRCPLRAGS